MSYPQFSQKRPEPDGVPQCGQVAGGRDGGDVRAGIDMVPPIFAPQVSQKSSVDDW